MGPFERRNTQNFLTTKLFLKSETSMKEFLLRVRKMLTGSRYSRAQRRRYYAQAIEDIKPVDPYGLCNWSMALCNVFRNQNIELCCMLDEFPEIKKQRPEIMYTGSNDEISSSSAAFWFKLNEQGKQQRLHLLRQAIKMIE